MNKLKTGDTAGFITSTSPRGPHQRLGAWEPPSLGVCESGRARRPSAAGCGQHVEGRRRLPPRQGRVHAGLHLSFSASQYPPTSRCSRCLNLSKLAGTTIWRVKVTRCECERQRQRGLVPDSRLRGNWCSRGGENKRADTAEDRRGDGRDRARQQSPPVDPTQSLKLWLASFQARQLPKRPCSGSCVPREKKEDGTARSHAGGCSSHCSHSSPPLPPDHANPTGLGEAKTERRHCSLQSAEGLLQVSLLPWLTLATEVCGPPHGDSRSSRIIEIDTGALDEPRATPCRAAVAPTGVCGHAAHGRSLLPKSSARLSFRHRVGVEMCFQMAWGRVARRAREHRSGESTYRDGQSGLDL